MTSASLVAAPGSVDLLVLGVRATAEGPVLADSALALPAEQRAALGAALAAVGARGTADEVLRLPGEPYGLPPLMTTGLGQDPVDAQALRRAAGAATRAASVRSVAMALPCGSDPALVEAVTLGGLIGAYRYTELRSPDPTRMSPQELKVVVNDQESLADALARAISLGRGVRLARRLVDTPPGHLYPARLAEEAVAALAGTDVEVAVLDEDDLADGGFGGILAVGQGSANPPRLVRLAHRPEGASAHLGLVGKGITFDSGGLSLKPAASMVHMKSDMAGAAAVLAAVRCIAELGIPLQVTAYLAVAENMPSGSAQRPGDVITAYGGTTVEVLNTDAEGRLVMMDALVRCSEDSPDAIVDVATLTGAQIVALGSRIAGIMANDDGWREEVHDAASAAGELAWPMPIPEEMRPSLDSPVADLANIGERNGGMLTAAAFLREFVPAGVPWAHIDIAGPSFVESTPWAYNGKGATGYGVRTLVTLAERMAEH